MAILDTNLTGVDLSTSTLTGVTSLEITGTPAALPAGWHFISGYLMGPGAGLHTTDLGCLDLSGIDLTGANLYWTNLTGANLTNATLTNTSMITTNLTDATLTGVISGGITVTPSALPAGWTLVNGTLVHS